MDAGQYDRDDTLDLSTVRRINDVCDRFELAIKSGDTPTIEDYLLSFTRRDQDHLFRHLLRIELEHRRVRCHSPELDEYRGRFPEFVEIVQRVFRDSPTVPATRLFDTSSEPNNTPAGAASLPLPSRYEVIRRAGQGATGTVYHCHDKRLERDVTIKVLRPGQSTKRFLREAQLLAKVCSPHVVAVHDFDTLSSGSALLCMEWINGSDLGHLMRGKNRPLDEDEGLRLMRETAEGMLAAAEAGVIHRDLKPPNILLDEDRRVRVADFGLASTVIRASDLTGSGVILGTPHYMAPEQAEDPRGVDTRADIYSFGATFYYALTGAPPFTGETAFAIQYKHKTEPLISPRARNPELSARTSDLLERCLAKSPVDRFQSFRDVLNQATQTSGHSPWQANMGSGLRPFWAKYEGKRMAYLDRQSTLGPEDEYRFPGGQILQVVRGDIVEQDVEAIVSSDDEYLSMGGGVSWRIRRAVGPQLEEEATRSGEQWMKQIAKNLTDVEEGFLGGKRYMIMDRDAKFCPAFREILKTDGVEPVLLPPRSPNLNSHLERFMRSIKDEALGRLIFFGERSLRRATISYLDHYHSERNHQGVENAIIDPADEVGNSQGEVKCRERLGGTLRYYYRDAA